MSHSPARARAARHRVGPAHDADHEVAGREPEPSGASRTRPSDSCPSTSRSAPGGAQPYSPRTISRSVPQIAEGEPVDEQCTRGLVELWHLLERRRAGLPGDDGDGLHQSGSVSAVCIR